MSTAPLFQTRAQGKLLLTGEYFVLDGATALAVPVRYGQSMQVYAGFAPGKIAWKSKNPDGTAWFEADFSLPDFHIIHTSDEDIAQTLVQILQACHKQNPHYFLENQSFRIETQNDFPREWGLGTSSTLIAALAQWMNVDPYKVLFDTLGGSGYDIACAFAKGPILYSLKEGKPNIANLEAPVPLTQYLYFVYLGKKQNSREGILRYRERSAENPEIIAQISGLTSRYLAAQTLADLDAVLFEHELLISRFLGLPRAKSLYFNDFWGEVKSLGAWGGDFVLVSSAASATETRRYFQENGFEVFLPWRDMVL